ncbi:hypothetical protein LAG90_12255 [Marinilongibacter aquaticus]|uniref:hypothetical protein n=1 Tax=Marinilongibacter aquaticus TaxID=2975157 RepID=UPI0021BDB3A3|nr:hypothetical protein [Marinilongibacter aquaticus]UBM57589.1 hypothetical protein LAG90_12255 [Marinilongibacter aquaticus]
MKKLPNILFFLIVIFGGIVLYLAFGGDPAITSKNLPADQIEKIEILRYEDEKPITITDKTTIDSLASLLYESEPIKVDNPGIASGLYYIKSYYTDLNNELIRVRKSANSSEGKYFAIQNRYYKNDPLMGFLISSIP